MLRCVTAERQGWHDARMADRDELIDAISGFGIFSDLKAPQLEEIIHIFDERMFAEGDGEWHDRRQQYRTTQRNPLRVRLL